MATNLAVVGSGSLVVVALVMGVAAIAARRSGRVSGVDAAWGLGFVLVAAWSALAGDGDLVRRLLLLVLVAVWGLRLAGHVWRRNRGGGEDPRYAELLTDAPGDRFSAALRRVYLPQGLAIWFVSLPVQVSAAVGPGIRLVLALGVLVWAVGFAFETVGDAQLRAFKADPDNRGRVMDRGVWGWSRHPNYFGDACVWWGTYVVAASAWPGATTLLSPVVMTYFLVRVTGVRLLEQRMSGRPGYAEYRARTSAFLPAHLPRVGPAEGRIRAGRRRVAVMSHPFSRAGANSWP